MNAAVAARIAAAAVAAACLSLLAPPANWAWLHWVVYLPMFWALRAETPRANRWLSFLYGTLGVGLLFRWIVYTITLFSPIPTIGAIAILGLFSSVFGLQYLLLWPAVHPMRRWLGPAWVAVFPAWEVLLEWGAMRILLFPYNHGVSQYHVAWTWQLASVTGVWGLSYLTFLVNTALAEAMYRHREGRAMPWRTLGATAAAVAVVLAYGAWRYQRITALIDAAPKLRVAQIQSSMGMLDRLRQGPREAFDDWLQATRRVPKGAADLVVWPEGGSPFDLNYETGRQAIPRELLAAEAKRGGFELAVGGGTRIRVPDPEMGEDQVQVFNSVYFFDAEGRVEAHYDKMVPLPFGEYLPFGRYFPDVARALNIGDFRAGDHPVMFHSAKAGLVATPICYEAILPTTCRLFRDADLLVVVTNDAWFGDTANPHQHAMLAATRAMELGIPMVRSAYTGVSFVVDPAGRWTAETKPFEDVERIVEVPLLRFHTLYSRLGDWFVGVCGAIVLAAAYVARGRGATLR
ncbi:MAG: apolipoprotein N-acyltransferase [Myxococcota bacterium]